MPGDDRMAASEGTGVYVELERQLPPDYRPLLDRRRTQQAIGAIRHYVEEHLCRELNLLMVQAPLIVDAGSGVNDLLRRDGSRVPVQFHIANDHDEHPVDAQVIQAAGKWKCLALREFGMRPGEGICADLRAVRKDDILDQDHSAYVDQWEWERALVAEQRNLATLVDAVRRTWRVVKGAELLLRQLFPELATRQWAELPDEVAVVHADELAQAYPGRSRPQREAAMLQRHPALFVVGIGWPLRDGRPHDARAADCDDWSTEVAWDERHGLDPSRSTPSPVRRGLNGDLLVWNPVTCRRHVLGSIGVRVDGAALRRQLQMCDQLDLLELPFHRALTAGELPPSVGGSLGQSRLAMLLLRKAHLGEVSVAVWPAILREVCARRNIPLLE